MVLQPVIFFYFFFVVSQSHLRRLKAEPLEVLDGVPRAGLDGPNHAVEPRQDLRIYFIRIACVSHIMTTS